MLERYAPTVGTHAPLLALFIIIFAASCKMPFYRSFVSLGKPKGLLPLLPLLGMHPYAEKVFWKVLVGPAGHPQSAWKHCVRNPIVNIIFKMLFF